MKLKNPKRLPSMQGLELDWLYNWGGKRPELLPADIDFIPMIWGYWGKDDSIRRIAQAAKKAGIKELLGFNEPDGKRQANLKVEKALKAWPVMMESGLRLGSPGCVHPDGDWMKEFMPAAKRKGFQVDFICVHSYGEANAKAFLNRMEKVHRLFKKPLWITEFAVADWQAKSPTQNRHKPVQILRFMEKVLPALEKLDYVEKYAWFPAGQKSNALGPSALFDAKGDLTNLGKFYRDVSA